MKPNPPKGTRQILVFDFDGVLCNSVHDSLMTAVNTYIQFVPDHRLPVEEPLDADRVFRFEEEHPSFFDQFSRLMPMGNFARDYFIVIRIVEKNETDRIDDQSLFDEYKRSIPTADLTSYQTLFYKNRSAMRENDPESWAGLLPPFPGILDAVRSLSQQFICAIATSKDRKSVDMLLKHWGMAKYFLPDNILDKDFAQSKREHLTRFHEKQRVPFSRIHFIDDKVSHLLSVKTLGVQAYLALWGFNTEREHEIARKEGFILLRLEELTSIGNRP
ncbi:MAG: HAD hydrolase-like protein [bacterium]